MTDFDVDAFDVTEPTNVDIEASLEERTPGGLGLHLIQTMVDNLEYDWKDRRSTIRFTKG
jgi:anti-sigma regulatory factor (Ser/Thr protein kinase)